MEPGRGRPDGLDATQRGAVLLSAREFFTPTFTAADFVTQKGAQKMRNILLTLALAGARASPSPPLPFYPPAIPEDEPPVVQSPPPPSSPPGAPPPPPPPPPASPPSPPHRRLICGGAALERVGGLGQRGVGRHEAREGQK